MKLREICIIIVLSLNVLIRLIPTLYTNNLFSNDVWPILRMTKYIESNPSVKIISLDKLFGHHAHYPIAMIQSVVYNCITNVSIEVFYKFIGVPILTIPMSLFAYLIAKKRKCSFFSCIQAALALSLIPSFTLYTSSYLKEFYAHVLFIMLIFANLYGMPRKENAILLLIISVSLILSHPLTSSMAIAMFLSSMFVSFTYYLKNGFKIDLNVNYVGSTIFLLTAFSTYNFMIVKPFIIFTSNDVIMLIMYTLATHLAYLFLGGKLSASVIGLSIVLAFIHVIKTITTPISIVLILLVLPPILSIFTFGKDPHIGKLRTSLLLSIATVFLFISTYMVETLSLMHRFFNYLVYVLMFIAINASEEYKKIWFATSLLLLVMVIYVVALTSIGENPYTFYWRYTDRDIVFIKFVEGYSSRITIYADPKYNQLFDNVEPISIHILRNICKPEEMYVLTIDNIRYGIPLSPIDFYRFTENIFMCRSPVFSDGYVYAFA